MARKVAVNGLGRIGRLVLRELLEDDRFEVVAVNDIASMDTLAYLLKHSSERGPFGEGEDIYGEGGAFVWATRASQRSRKPMRGVSRGASSERSWCWNAQGPILPVRRLKPILMRERSACSFLLLPGPISLPSSAESTIVNWIQVLPWCPARRAPPWGSRRLPPLSTSALPYSMAYRRRYTRSPLPRWYLTMPRGTAT